MPYSSIDKGSKYFNTKLYTGSTSQQSITGVGFKPDLIWFKNRATVSRNQLYDAVRGTTKLINSDSTDSEQTVSFFSSFDSDGYTIPSGSSALNGSGESIVSWNWLGANTTASNTSGTITSTVSANTTSGFSIVSYTGNGTNGATVGHGLGVAPKMLIVKNRTYNATNWKIYHVSMGATKSTVFGTVGAETDSYAWNNTAPTASVFTLGTTPETNSNGDSIIAYCFAEVKGFSKFGSYTGNGSTDGTFIYTGFKPAWVMVKKTNASGTNWQIIDNKRSDANGNNIIDKVLSPNATDADYDEGSSAWCGDLLSNGFKWRGNWGALNNSGDTYIYMAFAESPFVSSKGIPTTAR